MAGSDLWQKFIDEKFEQKSELFTSVERLV